MAAPTGVGSWSWDSTGNRDGHVTKPEDSLGAFPRRTRKGQAGRTPGIPKKVPSPSGTTRAGPAQGPVVSMGTISQDAGVSGGEPSGRGHVCRDPGAQVSLNPPARSPVLSEQSVGLGDRALACFPLVRLSPHTCVWPAVCLAPFSAPALKTTPGQPELGEAAGPPGSVASAGWCSRVLDCRRVLLNPSFGKEGPGAESLGESGSGHTWQRGFTSRPM